MLFIVLVLAWAGNCLSSFPSLPFSWDKPVATWVDFGTRNPHLLTEEQAKFIANTYEIVSLEKCFGTPFRPPYNYSTEEAFVNTTHQLKGINPNLRVLYYWSTNLRLPGCYSHDKIYAKNVDKWGWRDDNGNFVRSSPRREPVPDYTNPQVRDFWVNAVLDVIKMAGKTYVDGIFADGSDSRFWWVEHRNISKARGEAWNHAKNLALQQMTDALHKVRSDMVVLGNGLSMYFNVQPDHGMGQLPFVDGVCLEHYGAFEGIEIDRRKHTYKYNSTMLRSWLNVVKETLDMKKIVIMKTWIGPETTPIDGRGPTWPLPLKRPPTNNDIATRSLPLIKFPLASYLCSAQPGLYFSYAWWYDVHHVYPCKQNCTVPEGFYPDLMKVVGKPLTPPQWSGDGMVCSRSFEHVDIVADMNAVKGTISWKTH